MISKSTAPVRPPHSGGVLFSVLEQVFPDAERRLAVSLKLASCGIYSLAELWTAITTPSDAHFYKIPKPFTYENKARLVNELVTRSTAEQEIFATAELTAIMELTEGGDGAVAEGFLGQRANGEPKEPPATEKPMETPMQ